MPLAILLLLRLRTVAETRLSRFLQVTSRELFSQFFLNMRDISTHYNTTEIDLKGDNNPNSNRLSDIYSFYEYIPAPWIMWYDTAYGMATLIGSGDQDTHA
jgi:hypothetical protein